MSSGPAPSFMARKCLDEALQVESRLTRGCIEDMAGIAAGPALKMLMG
jgi:hypothetical protein